MPPCHRRMVITTLNSMFKLKSKGGGGVVEHFWQLECAKTALNFNLNKLSTLHDCLGQCIAWSNCR